MKARNLIHDGVLTAFTDSGQMSDSERMSQFVDNDLQKVAAEAGRSDSPDVGVVEMNVPSQTGLSGKKGLRQNVLPDAAIEKLMSDTNVGVPGGRVILAGDGRPAVGDLDKVQRRNARPQLQNLLDSGPQLPGRQIAGKLSVEQIAEAVGDCKRCSGSVRLKPLPTRVSGLCSGLIAGSLPTLIQDEKSRFRRFKLR